ncbi:MAG: permease family protein [Patescibacteria group bacterium]|nr:permease family protein [Patescibacteria group bacterium]
MRLPDTLRMAQGNLVRSKLRTFLTVIAVFIGALTISLTNGVGNGIKAYINQQLGNVGVEHTLIVQAKQLQQNPVATNVNEYNPDIQTGAFNIVTLKRADIPKMQAIEGVKEVEPQPTIKIEYVTTGDKKYQAVATQYIDGFNIDMASGKTVDVNSPDRITIPFQYLGPLGLGNENEALGKTVTLGFKDVQSNIVERKLVIEGVQQSSIIGNSGFNIGVPVAKEIYELQTAGVPQLADSYQAFTVKYDPSFDEARVEELKTAFDKAGYQAMTIEDQIGVVSKVIDAILVALNLFGAIALLAASFGIVNTLLMAVNERTREIGLMKALGASRRSIFSIFAFEAVSIGFWGALLGILASIGIGGIVNNIASNTFLKDFAGFELLAFPLLPSLGIMLLITVIAFIAGALPSLKASRLDPIEALRYE